MKKLISALLIGAMIVGLFAACEQGTENNSTNKANERPQTKEISATHGDDDFILGAYLPLSGVNASYAFELRQTLDMARDYINENGGMNGVPMTIKYYDTTSSTEEAAKITVKMVEIDGVDAVVSTPMSSEILASVQTLMDAKILTFAMGTSGSVMKDQWDYLYRASYNSQLALPQIIKTMNDLSAENFAIFFSQDETSITLKDLIISESKAAGMKCVASETFDAGDTDFSAQITNIVACNPDLIVLDTVGDYMGLAVKQIRQYGYNGIILNKEDMSYNQVDVAGVKNCDYTAIVNPYLSYLSIEDCDIDIVKDFLTRYKSVYGTLTTSDWPYRGWDSMMTLWEASKIAKSNDSTAMKEAMSSVKIDGLAGALDFTNSREGYNSFNSFMMIDGKKVTLKNFINDGGYDAYKKETGRSK